MTGFGQKPLASLSSTLLARKGTARPAMRPQGFGGFGAPPGQHDDLGWNDMGHTEDELAAQQGYQPQPQPYPEQAYPAAQPYPAQPTVPPVLRQREALQEEFESPAAYEPPVPSAYQPEQGYEAEDDEEEGDEEGVSGQVYADLGRATKSISRSLLEAMPEPVEPMPVPEPRFVPIEARPAPVEPRPMPVESGPVESRPVAVAPRPVSVATARRIAKEAHAKGGKAAFTLRLDQDRHLRLRLASALHNVSAQVLVTEALDHFLQSLPEVDELARQLPPQAGR